MLINYMIHETIFEDDKIKIAKGRDGRNGRAVLVKTLKSIYPTHDDVESLRHEYKINETINELPGIIKSFEFLMVGQDAALIMEDSGSLFLSKYLLLHKLTLEEKINIAIEISKIINDIHDRQIIHRNLNSHSIFIQPNTKNIRISNFIYSTEIIKEIQPVISPSKLSGDLNYISPEQTGRMNRAIDYRTDYYSLGIVLYELFTGILPFKANDSLSLIHAHIARQPLPLSDNAPEIPAVISDMVLKLLSKEPERRYQNLRGFIHDLTICRDQLHNYNAIGVFEIGRFDENDTFRIPEKLYAREKEVNCIVGEFEKASNGEKRIVLFKGPPGIGKSYLMNEIQASIAKGKGLFGYGKFDQFNRIKPYIFLINGFQSLLSQILSESDDNNKKWKNEILNTIGDNGRLIIDIIPELEYIIGPQKPLPDLSPVETVNRFNNVFSLFIKVFATPEHPLVLFIDDMQWADNASLNLINHFYNDNQITHLLIIGAYRDNEVIPGHPLEIFIEGLIKNGIDTCTKAIGSLHIDDIKNLVKDSFDIDENENDRLSKIIYNKTEGNPFFIKEYLLNLYKNHYISYEKKWLIDFTAIESANITDNIVDLIIKRVKKIHEDTMEILFIASCVGIKFSIPIISKIVSRHPDDVLNLLKPAINENIILKVGDKILFSHDKIHEAIYSLLDSEEKINFHNSIWRSHFAKVDDHEIDEIIYEIVHHLNISAPVLDASGRKQLIKYNLLAGVKSKKSTAYESAYNYLKEGIRHLDGNAWAENYGIALMLYTECGEVAYILGHNQFAEQCFKEVLHNATDVLDKVKVYEVKIAHYSVRQRLNEALQLGIEALGMLGVKMPKKANPISIMKGIIEARLQINKISIDKIIDLPDLTDPGIIAVVRMLMASSVPCYMRFPEYLPIIILKLLNISLKHGNSGYAAYAYATYGLILCGVLGNSRDGYRFGLLAIDVLQKYAARELECKVNFLFGNMINHWSDSLQKDIPFLTKAYRYGIENGDMLWASYSINYLTLHYFFIGTPLKDVLLEYDKYYEFMKRSQNNIATQAFELWYQFIANLHSSDNIDKISGKIADEDVFLPQWRANNNLNSQGFYTMGKQIIYYLYGDFAKSVDIAMKGRTFIDSMTAMIFVPEYNYFYSLAMLAHYRYEKSAVQKKYRIQIKKNQKKMMKWAHFAPMNYKQKFLLVEAERLSLTGPVNAVIQSYDRAIAAAKTNGFIYDEAIANECAARFLVGEGMQKAALPYIKEARYLYKFWGANHKVKQLEENYSSIISEVSRENIFTTIDRIKETSLDINTVMKASHAISGEINLDKLNETLISIILENAGAQRGLLMLVQGEELFLRVEYGSENKTLSLFQSLPLAEFKKIPHAVINYVKRTKEAIVLNDASKEGLFKDDPYIRSIHAHSILCVPLVKQQELKGIIYLENNLVIGAFPTERQEIVQLLSTQAAISIENALLFERTVQNEQKLEQNYEDMQAQYEKIERMNEEMVQTYNELELANRNLAHESELLEIFKQFAETSGQGFGMCDLEGLITYANAALCHMLGVKTFDELRGQKAWRFLPEEFINGKRDIILRSLRDLGEWTDEMPIRNPAANTDIPSIQNIFVLRDNKNTPMCYGVIITDLTDMKKAEETLRESEERYRLLVETMKEGLCMLDVDCHVTYINTSLASLLGYDLNEIIGHLIFEFLDHKNKIIMKERLELMQQGDNNPYELDWLRKDSNRLSTIVSPQAIYNVEGTYIASFGVITDITEKKKAEEEHEVMQRQLLQSQKMEAIGNLAGGVAHDFNNLLTAIIGYGSLLMNQIDSRDDRHELVKEIIKAAERSAVLTRQLLAFSRKQIIEATVFDLNKVVTDMEKMLRRLIGEDIQFEIELDRSINNICADRGHIEQVLMNLVVNARDAMPSGGRLAIKTGNVLIGDEKIAAEKDISAGRYVSLTVEDSGIGMDEELMQNIFEPFFTTKDISKGTGLGLSVVYGIVKQHGGHIYVSSRPNEGASFRIYLPAVESDQAAFADESIQKRYMHGNGERILLVEDQLEVRKFTSTALEQYGYTVYKAESVKEAFDIFRSEEGRFDILFCDVVLPDGNGLDIAKKMLEEKKELKIIMTSGYMEQRSQFSEIKEKGYTFIQKPYSLDTMLHVIGSISLQK